MGLTPCVVPKFGSSAQWFAGPNRVGGESVGVSTRFRTLDSLFILDFHNSRKNQIDTYVFAKIGVDTLQ